MLFPTAVAVVLSFWASLYLLDAALKTHPSLGPRYVTVMNKAGLSIHLGQVRWYTSCLNRTFVRLGTMRPRFLVTWFSIGMVFGCFAMVAAQVLLMLIAFNSLSPQPVEQQVLVPVMPGVNLPMSQIGYYLLTLFVCGVFHECGHAIAAVREKVRVTGFGVFVFALYPGAFVDISTEQLQTASPVQQLRIYCAGVWHNLVIVILAIMTMFLLPAFLMPLYSSGDAAFVTFVAENSPVSGQRGLIVGDHVTGIDGCQVSTVSEWVNCVRMSMEKSQHGYCVPLDVLLQQDVSAWHDSSRSAECCSNMTLSHLCFTYHAKKSINSTYACLPARSTSERPSCVATSDCHLPSSRVACVTPVVDNSTRLMRVRRHAKSTVLFYGHPLELYYSVQVSDYIPRLAVLPLNLFYILDTFCRYLVSLSGALALLNVVPCYALDGQWILLASMELLCRHVGVSRQACSAIYRLVLGLGTLTLFTNIAIAIWTLFVH